MFKKKIFSLIIVIPVLIVSLGLVAPARANEACGNSYTVVRGDTLRKIALRCDTTVSAIERANPSIKNPNLIFPGQVFVLPGAILPGTGGFDIYIVQHGDTLTKLAARFNTTVAQLLKLNTDITDRNLIFEGQRLTIPAAVIPEPEAGGVYIVQRGDTLRKIAARFDTTVEAILKLNPQIKDRNLIFTGQRILIPQGPTTYIVKSGDTLRSIAIRFDTTVDALLKLNPQIKDANLIFVGQVIRIR